MSRVSLNDILNEWPEYQGKFIVVKDEQYVSDIMKEIKNAHIEFRGYYDAIALYFADNTTEKICKNIYNFLKKNVHYKAETVDLQSTGLPSRYLTLGKGDCKHYASFTGGILDALNRQGYNIDWIYRFASYDILEMTPYHVFVVVYDKGNEIWIDPTPGSENEEPVYWEDIKIKKTSMPLVRYVAGFEQQKRIGVIPPAVIKAGAEIVTNLLKSLLSSINIGDQVPDYPIKSKTTLQKIISEVKSYFPDPVSIADANQLLQKAMQYAADARAKGGNVSITYAMFYEDIAATLKSYIASGGEDYQPVSVHTEITPIDPYKPLPLLPASDNSKTLMIVGAAGLGLLLLNKSNSKKVSGISNQNILLLGAAGILAYKFLNKGSNGTESTERQALITWIKSSAGDSQQSIDAGMDAFTRMTDTEIHDVYNFVTNYVSKNIPVPEGSALYNSILAMSAKYNIFN